MDAKTLLDLAILVVAVAMTTWYSYREGFKDGQKYGG